VQSDEKRVKSIDVQLRKFSLRKIESHYFRAEVSRQKAYEIE
jgi:hypothetical protein